MISEFLSLKQLGPISPSLQILIICALFFIHTFQIYKDYKKTGKAFGFYPVHPFISLAPIWEEVLFRGLILVGLLSLYSPAVAIVISSLLFGLWHFKNICFLPKRELVNQMIYAGTFFGLVVACVTLISGTIWLAVIVHYLNNILSPILKKK